MTDPWQTLIERIHAAPQQAVIVVTGGGTAAISELLAVPGGSRTLLEAVVPYSAAALTNWLGKCPEHFCVEETALAMAAVAFEQAWKLERAASIAKPQAGHEGRLCSSPDTGDSPDTLAVSPRREVRATAALAGLACTASLASDRPKKGDHRAHVATQTESETRTWSLLLAKGARSRRDEEQLVGQLILYALAQTAGLDDLPALDLFTGETIVVHRAAADPLLIELLAGRQGVVWSLPDDANIDSKKNREDQFSSNRCPLPARLVESEIPASSMPGRISEIRNPKSEIISAMILSPNPATFAEPVGLLCGSFHPLHFGHEQLRVAAERQLGGPVYYEMSIRNVDKPPLDFLSIERRRAQFTSLPLALTAAPTFADKAVALPGTVFVTGVDTAERIVEPRYYQGSDLAMREALSQVRSAGCRFLVAGRKVDDRFETLADVSVPAEFADLFAPISPGDFRADVSSTELRRGESG